MYKKPEGAVGVSWGRDGEYFFVQTFCNIEHDGSSCGCMGFMDIEKEEDKAKQLAEKLSEEFKLPLVKW